MLVAAVGEAFRSSFLLAGAAGLLAAALLAAGAQLAPMARGRRARARAPPPPTPRCTTPSRPSRRRSRIRATPHRTLPKTGGVTGFLQDQALKLLDSSACKAGSSREELVLALADKDEAKRFEREYGVNPRTAAGLLRHPPEVDARSNAEPTRQEERQCAEYWR